MNLSQAHDVMVRTHMGAIADMRRAIAIELMSAPGVGKSSIALKYARSLARELGKPVGLTISFLVTVLGVDMRGFMVPAQGTEGRKLDTMFSTPFWVPTRDNTIVFEPDGTMHDKGTWTGPMPEYGILFLDEWGQAEEDVQKPAAELLLNGEIGNSRLPKGWRVMAASNRMKDRSGVKRPMMFTINRRMEIHVSSDVDVFIAYQNALPKGKRAHPMILSFAQAHPGVVFTGAVPDGTDPFCTPRSLCMLDAELRSLRSAADVAADRLPMDDIARECAQGLIGQAATSQLWAHLKYYELLPTIETILRDPAKAKVPEPKDAQMVAGFMIADKIDEQNADQLMVYLCRLMQEMQVLAVHAIKAKPEGTHALSMTEGFSNWLRVNSALLLASRAD